jgi:shikimate dehydrogenase
MKILKAALLGRSLDHSISPGVHRAIFDIVRAKCNTDYDTLDYSKIECKDEHDFLSIVEPGSEHGYRGFNVTFPYKFVASNLPGVRSSLVGAIHSANTITSGSPIRIATTDGDGFRFSVEKRCSDLSHDQYVLTILGAGGAARAVLHAVRSQGWERIIIAARNVLEAQRAVRSYPEVEVLKIDEIERDAQKQFIVQATPVGQRTDESLLEKFEWRDGDIAVDLVYNPLRTRFLDNAAHAGANIVDGLGMLMEQAALSQYFWMTGNESKHSLLTEAEFYAIHSELSLLVTPRWDAFVI